MQLRRGAGRGAGRASGRASGTASRAAVAACLLSCLLLAASLAARPQSARHAGTLVPLPPAPGAYIGDAACESCHAAEFHSYQTTAHHATSRIADEHSVAGDFHAGANLFKTSNPSLFFKMTADADGYHQTAVDEISPSKSIELTQRIDLAIGSGRKAQTYLYWKGDQLFELPVSWWIQSSQWINSPGYEDGAIRFDRPIYPRCLECHGTSFASAAPPPNQYVRRSLVLGIGCEKCHGPARAHVALYASAHPPAAGQPAGILSLKSLPRNRQIDTCALCHAGLGKPLAPALSYQPGAALEKYLWFPAMDSALAVDVHGNQVQLLQGSRCYRASTMTCTTCHNVHTPQRDAASYSKYCLDCHKPQQCGKFKTMGAQISKNCVDCHMPLKQSQALFSDSNQQTIQLPVRDHRIAIYADAGPAVAPH